MQLSRQMKPSSKSLRELHFWFFIGLVCKATILGFDKYNGVFLKQDENSSIEIGWLLSTVNSGDLHIKQVLNIKFKNIYRVLTQNL